mmetsp:Transcript_61946/g.162736  ORF Transcript_61946/g.162736 Transcript_61946/m.162736 type:complete len:322 (-) Transcript_61946:19-984(-)
MQRLAASGERGLVRSLAERQVAVRAQRNVLPVGVLRGIEVLNGRLDNLCEARLEAASDGHELGLELALEGARPAPADGVGLEPELVHAHVRPHPDHGVLAAAGVARHLAVPEAAHAHADLVADVEAGENRALAEVARVAEGQLQLVEGGHLLLADPALRPPVLPCGEAVAALGVARLDLLERPHDAVLGVQPLLGPRRPGPPPGPVRARLLGRLRSPQHVLRELGLELLQLRLAGGQRPGVQRETLAVEARKFPGADLPRLLHPLAVAQQRLVGIRAVLRLHHGQIHDLVTLRGLCRHRADRGGPSALRLSPSSSLRLQEA